MSGEKTETRLAELEARLSRTTCHLRALSVLLMGVVVAAATLVSARPGATGVEGTDVRAPFRVRDTAGRLVMEVTTAEDKNSFWLYNPIGERMVNLMATPSEAGLALVRGGKPVFVATYTEDGGILHLSGDEHAGTLQLGIFEGGDAILLASTPDDEEIAVFGRSRGLGLLRLSNADGETRVGLAGEEQGGSLALFSEDVKVRAYLKAEPKGGHAYLYGPEQPGSRVHLAAVAEGAHMLLRTPEEQISGVRDMPGEAGFILRGEPMKLRGD